MKLVMFDIDGTLVDSQNFIVEAQRRAFAAHNFEPPSRERALSVVGLSLREAFVELTHGQGPAVTLAAAYKAAYSELRAQAAPEDDKIYPGVETLLRRLAERPDCKLGIATGKSRAGVQKLFDRQNWHGLFATVQTADDALSKPAPEMFERALRETGLEVKDACMVGDTTFDMMMGRRAGAHCIGVCWGYHSHEKLRPAGAQVLVHNVDELSAKLDAFLQ
ncbi:phosphoglycolate phosphatase [Rhodoblastus acidophilus]|uniref:Phosphoglycolate phosphatase n=1 Tax=Rhodoblastus acidophilus TaxID=1074 RepID=A0A212RH99_RHOAC|nr:HAD-IA family hydrolase [Rhodoblastus acidophilus]PPQ39587.1 HAD family hydrolase [Rhodoblastus acidophilus]RAI24370.1 HAD family hydrolase [Rhodoblastus acidophilus]SNB71583.1 phosphoglycolate phosphatase [Rhodoblastus acidophilus]